MSLGLNVLPLKSTLAAFVPYCCFDGDVGFGGGAGIMTHDRFILPFLFIQSTGISLRLRASVGPELVADSSSVSGSGSS